MIVGAWSLRAGFLVCCLLVAAGCSAPKPELLPQMERDSVVYVDKGAIKRRTTDKFRIAVCMDRNDAARHPGVAAAVNAKMAEVVSRFKFFELVERQRLGDLAVEQIIAGKEANVAIPADCLLSVKLNGQVTTYTIQVQNPYTKPPLTSKNYFKLDMAARAAAGTHPENRYQLELNPDFRLWETESQSVALVKTYKTCAKGLTSDQIDRTVQDMISQKLEEFSMLITSRYAPTSRVLQTRGNGQVANISIGSDYGLTPEMNVEFFEYIDNSDLVAGATRDLNLVGRGRVLEVSPKTAWVEVLDYEKVHVKRGHYVRIPEGQVKESGFGDKLRMDLQL